MATPSLEQRVAALESKVARLSAKLDGSKSDEVPWWQTIFGTFSGDKMYAEAMRLGREYRESLRPKRRQQRVPSKRKRARRAGA